jgi:peptide deformylase
MNGFTGFSHAWYDVVWPRDQKSRTLGHFALLRVTIHKELPLVVLRTRIVPDPILRVKTQRVLKFDDKLNHIVLDMIDTMRHLNGVGLAANQVGINLRVCVIELPEEKGRVRVLVNPVVTTRAGSRELEEGCLSYPGYRGTTARSDRVVVRAQDLKGRSFTIRAANSLLAHAIEHETDHLDGAIYLDRLISKDAIWKVQEPAPEHEGATARAP